MSWKQEVGNIIASLSDEMTLHQRVLAGSLSDYLNIAMPKIGFASPSKRVNAFFIICELIEDSREMNEEISFEVALLAIMSLYLNNKKFEKAIGMWFRQSQGGRFGIGTQPKFASELSGFFGI